MTRATEIFRIVHAGHDVSVVAVVCGNVADPPLICWTCHEEQRSEPGGAGPGGERGGVMKVRYRGDASEAQIRWGGNDDPRLVLTVGSVYEVERADVHSWHTKYFLVGVPGHFNSVHFDDVKEP